MQMGERSISLDTDAAAATVADWRAFADHLEHYGSRQHLPAHQLTDALGDVYGEFVAAKSSEYAAREAAYQRLASRSRDHADRLDRTRQIFVNTDENSATQINGVLDA